MEVPFCDAPVVDPEFRALIWPLALTEHAGLEASILAEGCRDALVIWKETGILLDGHNRYEICQRLGKKFRVHELSFPARLDAKIWLIQNQFNRRNLNEYQRCELALNLKPLLAEKARGQQGARTDLSPILAKSVVPIDTRKELSKAAG